MLLRHNRQGISTTEQSDHGTREIVARHFVLCHTLKEVALLATRKALARAAKRGVEQAHNIENLAPNGHIATTGDATLGKESDVLTKRHRIGYRLFRVARHPAGATGGVLGNDFAVDLLANLYRFAISAHVPSLHN